MAMGVQVAERTRHSVLMTPVGLRIVARARLLLREAEALMALGAEQARPMSGRLELGVLPTIGPYLLPRLIRALGARFPLLKLGLREDRTGNLLKLLAEGRLDLVLMAFPYDTPGMERMLLFDDAYRYVTAADSARAAPPQASARPVSEADFEGESLLLLEHEHCLHSHALPTLQRIGELAQASYAATSLPTLVAMVAEGLGSTLLPDLAINGGILHGHEVTVLPLAEGASARSVGLCWRRGAARVEYFRTLGEFIAEWAQAEVRPWQPVDAMSLVAAKGATARPEQRPPGSS
jgi:LysR family hydrogen peroxide-inducible transcriptional activator